MNRIITLVAIVIIGLVALGGTRMALAQTTSALEALRAREQLDALFIQVRAAIDQAAGNPRAFVEALPRELREGNEQMFEAILNMQPGQTAQRLFSGSPDDPAREVFSRQVRVLSRRYVPERHPLMLEREALNAIVNQGSANWPYLKGHFLAPELPAPYGTFTPNCENHWCVPDLYISDYDETDLDGRATSAAWSLTSGSAGLATSTTLHMHLRQWLPTARSVLFLRSTGSGGEICAPSATSASASTGSTLSS